MGAGGSEFFFKQRIQNLFKKKILGRGGGGGGRGSEGGGELE